jgi:predicted nucleic acid-binding protein
VTAVDTSVVVAAFASWHESHAVADQAVSEGARLIAHCAIESYSVLTRLPAPHRAPPALVRDFLLARFTETYLTLSAEDFQTLTSRLPELGISGGAVYDALVAVTALSAGESLVSCDRRAAPIYERVGVRYRLLE